MNILEIDNLKTCFETQDGVVQAVRGISLNIKQGEMVGIVGESGSGKSVTMFSLMGLLVENGYIIDGTIKFNGDTLLDCKNNGISNKNRKKQHERLMSNIRGKDIGMIFQDPMTFLNPTLTIGYQLTESVRRHLHLSRYECRQRALDLLKIVEITNPESRLRQYPFELSGGMRQRIIIAMALICHPKLLIADEPTTALDVTIQAQILDLMGDLRDKFKMSIILVTHDLGVVASTCTKILVMYGGIIVEEGSDIDIFQRRKHPYTSGLLKSITSPNDERKEKLKPIEGSPPDLLVLQKGCPFTDRCNYAMRICRDYLPPMITLSETHSCRCWLSDDQVIGKKGSVNID